MPKSLRSLDHQAIMAALRQVGHEKKINQKRLARRLRRNPSWVSKVLNGDIMLDTPKFMQWARVYEMKPHELMQHVEDMRTIFLRRRKASLTKPSRSRPYE